MTKNFFLTLSVTISGFMSAQTVDSGSDSQFKFGVKAGYNLSTMKFFDDKLDSQSYFYVGLVGEQPVSSKVGIQAEVLYTQLGGKQDFPLMQINNSDVQISSIQFDYQLTQIQIPVSVKYYFIPDLSASVGMNAGFNVSEKVKTQMEVNGETSRNYEGIKSLNLFPFLGAQYQISNRFFVDAKYNFNFIEIQKGDLPTKVGFLQAGVGYRFN